MGSETILITRLIDIIIWLIGKISSALSLWWAERRYLDFLIKKTGWEIEKYEQFYKRLDLHIGAKERNVFYQQWYRVTSSDTSAKTSKEPLQLIIDRFKRRQPIKLLLQFEIIDGPRYALLYIAHKLAQERKSKRSSAPLPILLTLGSDIKDDLTTNVERSLEQYRGKGVGIDRACDDCIFLLNILPQTDHDQAKTTFQRIQSGLVNQYIHAHYLGAYWEGNENDRGDLGGWETRYVKALSDDQIKDLLKAQKLQPLWSLLMRRGLTRLMQHAFMYVSVVKAYSTETLIQSEPPGKVVQKAINAQLWDQLQRDLGLRQSQVNVLENKLAELSLQDREFDEPDVPELPKKAIFAIITHLEPPSRKCIFLSQIFYQYYRALAISKELPGANKAFEKAITSLEEQEIVVIVLLASLTFNLDRYLEQILNIGDVPQILLAITFAFNGEQGVDDRLGQDLRGKLFNALNSLAEQSHQWSIVQTQVKYLYPWWSEDVYGKIFEPALGDEGTHGNAIKLLSYTSPDVVVDILGRVRGRFRSSKEDILRMSGAMNALAIMAMAKDNQAQEKAQVKISDGIKGNWDIGEVGRAWATYADYKRELYQRLSPSLKKIVTLLGEGDDRLTDEVTNVLYCLDMVDHQRVYDALRGYFRETLSALVKKRVIEAIKQLLRNHSLDFEFHRETIEPILKDMNCAYHGLDSYERVTAPQVRRAIAELFGEFGTPLDYAYLDDDDAIHTKPLFLTRFSEEQLDRERQGRLGEVH